MARHVASQGGKVLYLLTVQGRDSLLEEAEHLGLSIDELVKSGNIKIKRLGEPLDSNESQQFLIDLHSELERFRPDLIIMDELTDLLAPLDSSTLVGMGGRMILEGASATGAVLVGLCDAYLFKLRPEVAFYILHRVDIALRLRKRQTKTGFILRVMDVEKARGVYVNLQSVEYAISRVLGGVQSIGLPAEAQTVAQAVEEGAFETGIAQLDETLGGGIPRGTVILVLGPVGAGKCVLAAQTCLRVADRGERAAYASFKSSEVSIRKMFDDLGLSEENLDNLKIVSVVPQALRSLDQLTEIIGSIRKFDPDFIALDGYGGAFADALGGWLTEVLTRHLQIAAKRSGISVMLTAPCSKPLEPEGCVRYLAQYSDIVLALVRSLGEGSVERRLKILKAPNPEVEGVEFKLALLKDGMRAVQP